MKQIRNYSLLASAMLTFAFTSCNSNEIETIPYEGPVPARVTAGIDGVVTRASDAAWDNGDAIGISCSGTNTNYTNMKYVTANGGSSFTHEGGAASGIFFQGTEDVTFSAYYPFTDTEGTAPGTSGTISSSTETQANQKNFDYLYAGGVKTTYAAPNISFNGTATKFKHKMTRLILVIETSANDGFSANDVTSGTYTLSGIKHSGSFNTANGTAEATGTATNDWTISATPQDANSKRTYSMILYPQASPAPSLTFNATINDKTYSATITPALVASTSYTYTITVKKTGLTVSTCTIEGWGTEQTGSGNATMQ